MPVYLVERVLHGATMESLERLRQRTEAACRTVTARGKAVRYLRSTFAPGESRCQCLFEAPSSELVREVNDAAGFPYERIVLAVELEVSRSAGDSESIRYTKQRS
jgi:muconolactone delta-isomerase